MAGFTPTPNRPKHEKRVGSVVKNPTQLRKKNIGEKFAKLFFEESGDSIKEYVVEDLIIPAIKDAIIGAIEMLLYGTARSRFGSSKGSSTGYTPYNKYSTNAARSTTRDPKPAAVNITDYRDITYETRAEAEDVYKTMLDLIYNSEYGQATICDFFDASEMTNDNFQDDSRGWKELPSKYPVRHAPGGRFYLDMPAPINLT